MSSFFLATSAMTTRSSPSSSTHSSSTSVVRAAVAMTASATACVACHVVYSAMIHHHRGQQAACGAIGDVDGNGSISNSAASTNFEDDVELFAKDTPFHRKVLEQASNNKESNGIRSERPWGLLNNHLASLSAQFRPSPFLFGASKRQVTRRQERIALPIGDALDVEFFEPINNGTNSDGVTELPMVLLLHGINGHSTEPYIEQAAIQIVTSRGWRCVVLNYSKVRACALQHAETVCGTLGGGSNFMDSGDLNFLISHLRKSHHGFLAAVGFSMGGAKLIQYLGRTGVHSNLDAACCVSSPLDFTTKNETVWRANSLIHRLYHLGMSSNLKWWIVRNYQALKTHPRLCTAKPFRRSVSGLLWWFQATRVTDFDEAITIHAKGYEDLDTYYSEATAIERLRFDVRVPFLCITAKNDPMIPSEIVPGEDLAQDNEHVIVLNTTRLGGHLGYWLPGKGCWATRSFLSFFGNVQEHMDLILESSPAHETQNPRELHRKNSLHAARSLQLTSSTKLTNYMQLVALDSVSSFGSFFGLSTMEAEDMDVDADDDEALTCDICSVTSDDDKMTGDSSGAADNNGELITTASSSEDELVDCDLRIGNEETARGAEGDDVRQRQSPPLMTMTDSSSREQQSIEGSHANANATASARFVHFELPNQEHPQVEDASFATKTTKHNLQNSSQIQAI